MDSDSVRKQPLFNALAIFIAGMMLTGAFLAHLHQSQQSFRQARFQSYVDKTTNLLRERLLSYEHGVQGLRAAFLAVGVDAMRLDTFRKISLSRDPDREFPGVRGFGFIQRVAPGGEAAFEQAMQARGREGFAIKQLAPHADERFVITYIEPEARNRQAVGLDVGSEANRRRAMLSAFRSGKATLTHPITLVQADGKVGRGFLLILPFYSAGAVPDDNAAREAAALGATYSPLVIDEVLAGFDIASDGVSLSLIDVDEGAEPFYAPPAAREPAADGLQATRQIALFGRTWQADYRATPAFVAALPEGNPLAIGVLGLVASALLALLRFQEMRNRVRLRESEARLRLFVNNAPAALAMFDRQMRYLAVSARWGADFGLEPDALIGRSHYEVFPEITDEWRGHHQRALAGEVIRADRDAFHRADGQVQWLKWEIRPWYDSAGEIGGIVVVSEDVTYTHQVESEIRHLNATLEAQVAERTAELDAARRSLRTVLDAVPSMIGYWDKHLVNKVANHAYAEWFGVDADAVPGKNIRELLGEALYAQNRSRIEAALEGEPQTFERSIPRPDGKGMRHSLAHYLPDIVDGEVEGFFVVVHDVTELTESRERLAALLRENQLLLTSIDRQLIYSVTDANGRITHVNDKFCEVSGYSRDDLLGKDHRLLNAGVHGRAFWAEMWSELLAGRAWRADICNRARDGRLFWVDTVVAPMTNDAGQVERIVALRYDVTESKLAVRALENAKKEAERANIAKSAFLANTSHEIRTPLNVVIGMAYLLGKSTLGDEQREQVSAIQVASRTLLELINDVLDLAKIEAGEMVYDMRPFALANVMADTERLFRSQAELKGLDYRPAELLADLPEVLVGDELRLRQVLNNLIGNAVKFSDQGHVAVAVSPLHEVPASAADVLWLRFEVADTGCGVDEEAQARLFAPFTQVDGSMTRRHGGSGLGLSIVRQLVEGMGGRVGVDSAEGVGSTFWFELPFGRTTLRLPGHEAWRQRRALEILIVDDEPYQRDILLGMTDQLGWRAEAVPSGEAMIEQVLARTTSGRPVDCVILDWRMPGIDGLSALRTLRARLKGMSLPAVIMTTGHDVDALRREGADALTDRILPKPVNPSTLFNQVNEAVVACGLGYDHVLTATQISDGHSRWLPGVRVLVVDDSTLNLDVCRRILERQGAAVSVCGDGQQAVALVESGQAAFDLLLMDVQMPVMDGFTATRMIRQMHDPACLPIVALTAGVLPTQIDQAKAAGMNQVLSKPLDPEDLIRVIRMQIETVRGRPLPVERLPELPEPRESASVPDAFPEIPGIDRQQAYRRMQGDADFLQTLLSRFVFEAGEAPAQIEAMLRFGQAASVAAHLHKLRGIAANFGASRFVASAHALERGLVDNASDMAPLLAAFGEAHAELLGGIEGWLAVQPPEPDRRDEGAPPVDRRALRGKIDSLEAMLDSHLLSAGLLSQEIEAVLEGSALASGFRPVARAVRSLRYAVAADALAQFRQALDREDEA